ncbi:MAG: NAD(P)/FAD-dependent oxidoreductase [Thiolinea sp.]
MTTPHYDIAIIGAGIAGASVAARLAEHADTILLERESQPGYHSTGRSAAVYEPFYGPAPIRALTRASFDFFNTPPDGFAEYPLLTPTEAISIARADQLQHLEAMEQELSADGELRRMDGAELEARIPILRRGYATAGLSETATAALDVSALHQGYLRTFRVGGGVLQTSTEVSGLKRNDEVWRLETGQGVITAQTVVNAAGAWADQLGQLAGAEDIGLKPLRRTALTIDPPAGCNPDDLPLVFDVEELFYMKPDAGKLLISPANEDPESPCDVQPDEMDIAICVDRIERAFNLEVQRIESRWAGLRSFVADKAPVAGFSAQVEGFYWLAGQGGYGIQSSPALSDYAAAELLGKPVPEYILAEGLDPASLSPGRL